MIDIKLPKEGYYLVSGVGIHLCIEINNKKQIYDFIDETLAYQKLGEYINIYGETWNNWWMVFGLIPEYPLGKKGYKWLVGDSNNDKHIGLSWDFVGMCPIEPETKNECNRC